MTHKNLQLFLSSLMLLKSPSLWNYIIKRSLFFPYSCTTGLDFVTKGKERGSRNWKTPPRIFVGRSVSKCGDKPFHHRVRSRKVGYLRWAAADGDWGPSFERTGRQGKTLKTSCSQPTDCLVGGPEARRPKNRWGWTTGVWWVAGLNSVNSTSGYARIHVSSSESLDVMHVLCESRAVVALQVQQDEWLEEAKWGAFGQTLYEAQYLLKFGQWRRTSFAVTLHRLSQTSDRLAGLKLREIHTSFSGTTNPLHSLVFRRCSEHLFHFSFLALAGRLHESPRVHYLQRQVLSSKSSTETLSTTVLTSGTKSSSNSTIQLQEVRKKPIHSIEFAFCEQCTLQGLKMSGPDTKITFLKIWFWQ